MATQKGRRAHRSEIESLDLSGFSATLVESGSNFLSASGLRLRVD
jgi:hypothetical protein